MTATPPPSMTKDEAVAAARAWLVDKGHPEASLASLSYGPPPLLRVSATRPFHFLATRPPAGPPGRTGPVVCVAVDERDGAVYHTDPKAFAVYARALGLPGSHASVDPVQLLAAWVVLTEGAPPSLMRKAPGVGDKEVAALVAPPALSTEGDKAILTGWTDEKRGFVLHRHTVVIHADGRVEATTKTGRDNLE